MARELKPAALLIVTLVYIFLLLIFNLAGIHDPWRDEASLIMNFLGESRPHISSKSLFSPMDFLQQSTPLAHRILGVLITGWVEPRFGIPAAVLTLRLMTVAAALLMAFLVFRLTRLFGSAIEASAAAIVASANPFTIGLAIQVKHYLFEGAAAAAVFYTAALVSRVPDHLRPLFLFLITGFIGYMFSFTLLFVVASCSFALILVVVIQGYLDTPWHAEQRARGPFYLAWRTLYASRRPVLGCAFLVFVGLLFYFFYSKPIVSPQLSALPYVFQGAQRPLSQLPLEFLRRIVDALAPFDLRIWNGGRVRSILLVGFALLLGLSWLFALQRSVFAAISMLTCLILLMAAHVAGAFPFSNLRHLFFIVPVVAPVVVLGLAGLFHRVTPARFLENAHWSLPALGVIFCTYGAGAIVAAQGRVWEEISLQLAHVKDVSAAAPILASRSGRSALLLLASTYHLPLLTEPHELFDPDELKDLEKYLIWASDALRGLSEVWLLFSGEPESERGELVDVAQRIVGACRLEGQSGNVRLYHCVRP